MIFFPSNGTSIVIFLNIFSLLRLIHRVGVNDIGSDDGGVSDDCGNGGG